MVHSMTSFARAERSGASGVLSWELRSVNHRYAEFTIRLPDELRALEAQVREKLAARIHRGKVDATCRFRAEIQDGHMLVLDRDRVDALLESCAEIEQAMANPGRISALDILRWPGVLQAPVVEPDLLQSEMLDLLDEALGEFILARQREGDKIRGLILQRSNTVSELVQQVRSHAPAILQAQRDRLLARLQELKTEFNQERLEQELVYLAQRQDVHEELDRLDVHVGELQRLLTQSGPIGRRLDFLMQEFNREVNTLASKSVDSDVTASSVEMKVLVEQMREQIQNIE